MWYDRLQEVFKLLRFAEFIGQDQLLNDLRGAIAQDRVGHAYLLVGPEGSGRRTLARLLAQALLCESAQDPPCDSCRACQLAKAGTHPDLEFIQADGATIKIEQMRALKARVALKPLAGRRRVFLLADLERLSEAAANSILLTLEEPPPGVVFLGWALAGEPLLPTILSRFQTAKLHPLTVEALARALAARGMPSEQAEALAARAGGLPGTALRLLDDGAELAGHQDEFAETLFHGGLLELMQAAENLSRSDREIIGRRLDILSHTLREALRARYVDGHACAPGMARLAPESIWRLHARVRSAEEALQANANARILLEVLALAFFREREQTSEAIG